MSSLSEVWFEPVGWDKCKQRETHVSWDSFSLLLISSAQDSRKHGSKGTHTHTLKRKRMWTVCSVVSFDAHRSAIKTLTSKTGTSTSTSIWSVYERVIWMINYLLTFAVQYYSIALLYGIWIIYKYNHTYHMKKKPGADLRHFNWDEIWPLKCIRPIKPRTPDSFKFHSFFRETGYHKCIGSTVEGCTWPLFNQMRRFNDPQKAGMDGGPWKEN